MVDEKDPYSWLEAVNSKTVRKWKKDQNKASEAFLEKANRKEKGYGNINRYSYVDFELPRLEGNNYYKMMYRRLGEPLSLYIQDDSDAREELLLSPDEISLVDEINIDSFEESIDGKHLAIVYGRNGSDWKEVRVKRLRGGLLLKDHIEHVKFSGVAWDREGFYYLKYPFNDQFDAERNPKLMYHRLGTDQEEDQVLFARKSASLIEMDFEVTPSGDYLILNERIDNGLFNSYYIDTKAPSKTIKPLLPKLTGRIHVIDNREDALIFTTSHAGGANSVLTLGLNDPTDWSMLIPAFGETALDWARLISGKIVCQYRDKLSYFVLIFNKSGELGKRIDFDESYSVGGFDEGNREECFFYYSNYFTPPIVYRLNMTNYEMELVSKTKLTFDVDKFKVINVEYPSTGGVAVPLTIVARKDVKLNGKNPLVLKTYGGFGLVHSPAFDEGVVFFLERGGVFAYAHIRGEGTKGDPWAQAGKRENKVNSVSDYIRAAEYLIDKGYTSPEHLGITGASHGGLMVGAAMTTRPELYRAAVPVVGVFDMVNFEKYTVGVFHKDEFGTAENEKDLDLLRSYSPYHNIKPGVNYPTSLIITSENDDRVPPFHSYKFAAKLQSNPGQENPVLLRIEENAGHYGASSIDGSLQSTAYLYSFFLNVLR